MSADILVIDDEPLIRELVCEWLALSGHSTRQAADGWAGLEAVNQRVPDLVLTDICMPGHGANLINRLRREHPELPIIAMSGTFDAGAGLSSREAARLGADRTFHKPLERRKVVQAVAELLSRRHAPAATALAPGE
jgi:CheY-like chemotaxis protein